MADKPKKRRTNTQTQFNPVNPMATPVTIRTRRVMKNQSSGSGATSSNPATAPSSRSATPNEGASTAAAETIDNAAPATKRRKMKASSAWDPRVVLTGTAGGGLVEYRIPTQPTRPQTEQTPSESGPVDDLSGPGPEIFAGNEGDLAEPMTSPINTTAAPPPAPPSRRKRRKHAKREAKKAAWPRWKNDVIPSVVDAFLRAEAKRASRTPLPQLPTPETPPNGALKNINGEFQCPNFAECGQTLKTSVPYFQCVDFTRMSAVLETEFRDSRTDNDDLDITHGPILYCEKCQSLHQVLVECGYFPSSSMHPTIAFSFDILEFHTHTAPHYMIPVHLTRTGLLHLLRLHGVQPSGRVSCSQGYLQVGQHGCSP